MNKIATIIETKYRVEWRQDRQWVYELCETADEAKSLLSRLPAICRVDSKIIIELRSKTHGQTRDNH